MDGLLGRYKTIGCTHTHTHTHTHMHTPTPPNSQTGVSRGPLLCRQRLMMCLTDSFIPKLVPFSPPFFFFPSSLSISPSCCHKTRTCPLVNFEGEWQLIPSQKLIRQQSLLASLATPPSSHFDSHPLLFLSYLLQLLGTISNPVKVVCPVEEPLLSVCHLPENHIYMFHCHTLNPPRQLLSNPMRSFPPKNTHN